MPLGLGMSGIGIGPQFSGAAPPAGGAPSPNPNLLLWSEESQRGAWTTDGVVTADNATDPLGGSTADTVALPADGFLQQVSGTAATTGANASANFTLTTAMAPYSVSGTFDGLTYVYSHHLEGAAGGEDVRLIISRAGGFLVCTILENGGSPAIIRVWGAKLETPGLTDYVKREGT